MSNQIVRKTPTKDNPDGIAFVPEAIATSLIAGVGGGGASGATVAGPVVEFLKQVESVAGPMGKGFYPASSPEMDTMMEKIFNLNLNNQFARRFQSTGDNAITIPLNDVVFQTLDVSPENPRLIKFDQIILEAFTGDGQLNLVERDAVRRVFDGVGKGNVVISEEMNFQPEDEHEILKVGKGLNSYYKILSVNGNEVTLSRNIAKDGIGLALEMDGKNEEIIATKEGFLDSNATTAEGWSRFSKPITSDKVYIAKFIPGDTGDGIFLVSAQTIKLEDR